MKKIILSGLLLCLLQPAIAQTKPATSTQKASASLPIPEKVTEAEGITEYKLANGLKV